MKNALAFIETLTRRTTRTQFAIAAVCLLIGLLIATQLRAQQSASLALQAASESDLSEIVTNLNNEINALRAEEADLRLQLFKIERASSNSSTVMMESAKNLNNLKIIAGLAKVNGPGIKVTIIDKEKIINANDIVDLITELRVGGAEAISINGIRVVAQTGIIEDSNGIYLGGNEIAPPYEVLAIGEPEVLYETLAIAGGVRDKLSSLAGVKISIKKENTVRINSTISLIDGIFTSRGSSNRVVPKD